MAVESATYINQLDATLPTATDVKSEGDDHMRLTKATLKATFPNLTSAPVTPTTADLNTLAGAATTGGVGLRVVTQPTGDNSTLASSTGFVYTAVAAAAFAASLPAQAGNAGKYVTTNGTVASWTSAGGFSTLSATGIITATGGQIAFPATQVQSANANTLDDYAEGTWTPATSSQVNLTGITFSNARYTKVGRSVTLSCDVNCTVTTANILTYIIISGIPFAPMSTTSGSAFENNNTKTGSSQINSSYLNAFFSAACALASGAALLQLSITYNV